MKITVKEIAATILAVLDKIPDTEDSDPVVADECAIAVIAAEARKELTGKTGV